MTAIASHHLCTDNSHTAQNPAQDRYFKHNTHRKTYHQQSVYIRIYRYSIFDHITNLIHAKETKYKRKNEKIAEQNTQHEHDISPGNELYCILPLLVIQAWRDKSEQKVNNIWRCQHQSYVDGHLDMQQKLTRQSCINKSD